MYLCFSNHKRRIALGLLAGLAILGAGGCPKVQNGVVDAFQTTAVSVANSTATSDPAEILGRGVFSAVLSAFLNHFRVQIGN